MIMSDHLPITMICLFLSYLFFTGGYSKFRDIHHFQAVLADYRILPPPISFLFARLLPLIEILTGLALLITSLRYPGLLLATLLLAGFSCAMAINLLRGRADLECGCGGMLHKQAVNYWILGRNILLTGLAFWACTSSGLPATGALEWIFAFLGALLAALFYEAFNQLIANKGLFEEVARDG